MCPFFSRQLFESKRDAERVRQDAINDVRRAAKRCRDVLCAVEDAAIQIKYRDHESDAVRDAVVNAVDELDQTAKEAFAVDPRSSQIKREE